MKSHVCGIGSEFLAGLRYVLVCDSVKRSSSLQVYGMGAQDPGLLEIYTLILCGEIVGNTYC